jgi:hypothetical protein
MPIVVPAGLPTSTRVKTLQLGRMLIREDSTATEQSDSSGSRTMTISGQESIPRWSAAAVARQREDLLPVAGQLVPVIFSVKEYLNGFYNVEGVNGTIEDWDDDLVVFRWQVSLRRVGTESDTDIESRLSGALTRVNDFAVTGERSHSPAIEHGGYWTDATVTTAVSRTGEDGALKLYRGFSATMSPRWATTPSGYLTGRVRFVDETGHERAGDSARLATLGWSLSNGLVRVQALSAGGVLEVAAYTDGAWRPKAWDITFNAVTIGAFDYCSLLTNELGIVTVRLVKSMTNGRLYADVTLRRGHRFIEVYVQSEFGGALKIMRATNETGVNSPAGTVVASANDADGNKYIVGSARTFTADLNGGISKAAASTLDAFIGVVAAGTGAVAGDQAVDLQKQYLGLPSELVQAVRR